jgi:hypothetical protein
LHVDHIAIRNSQAGHVLRIHLHPRCGIPVGARPLTEMQSLTLFFCTSGYQRETLTQGQPLWFSTDLLGIVS